MIERLCPHARVGHGQMEGKKLEAVILDFMDASMMFLLQLRLWNLVLIFQMQIQLS